MNADGGKIEIQVTGCWKTFDRVGAEIGFTRLREEKCFNTWGRPVQEAIRLGSEFWNIWPHRPVHGRIPAIRQNLDR